MDDDGVLLNFASAPPTTKRRAVHDVASHMKGNWKRRRLAAKTIVAKGEKRERDRERVAAEMERAAAARPTHTRLGSSQRPASARQPAPTPPSTATAQSTSSEPKSRKELRGNAIPRQPVKTIADPESAKPWITSLFSSAPSAPSVAPPTEPSEPPTAPPDQLFDAHTFPGLGLNPFLSAHLASKGTKRPTAIQSLAIPVLGGPRKPTHDRDAIIQAQTGSGKTLAYLLPMIDTLMRIEDRGASRRSGLFGIVLAPTRELARQIYEVLEGVLNLSARSISKKSKSKKDSDSDSDSSDPSDSDSDDDNKESRAPDDLDLESDPLTRRPRWIVPGLVVGGDSKKSEKARIRKGINILVSTPGRLLDHLRNTKSLLVSKVRWLVLDEADRLMDLGFEETIKEIVGALKREGKAAQFLESWAEVLPKRRVTWLCSATMKGEAMERLQALAVEDPVVIYDKSKVDKDADSDSDDEKEVSDEKRDALDGMPSQIAIPTQLRQSYLVVPPKQRLVVLMALLRTYVGEKGKVIVFVSCQDSVDFLWRLFGALGGNGKTPTSTSVGGKKGKQVVAIDSEDEEDDDDEEVEKRSKAKGKNKAGAKDADAAVSVTGGLLPHAPLFRLHGSMPQGLRMSTFAQFTKCTSGVLLCTDVAARGLDLPNVSAIVQYDPPSDFKDYVHRAGRTARLGKAGKAVVFLLPSEVEYVDLLAKEGFTLQGESTETVLENLVKANRTGAAKWKKVPKEQVEKVATDVHMEAERWVASSPDHLELARRAFSSHVRAYATHGAAEKHIFHVRKLHLGHLAKSFGLREAPSIVGASGMGAGAHATEAKTHAKAKAAMMHRGEQGQQKRKRMITAEFGDGGVSGGKLLRGPTVKKKNKGKK